MEYHGTTYNVVQSIERRVWKWSVAVEGMVLTGQERTQAAAVAAAEKAIDRALAPKKMRLRPHRPGLTLAAPVRYFRSRLGARQKASTRPRPHCAPCAHSARGPNIQRLPSAPDQRKLTRVFK